MDDCLVGKIREAFLAHLDKCGNGLFNPYFGFEDLIKDNYGIDLSTLKVPLLVRASSEGLALPGQLCGIGDIYAILIPYSELPRLLEDERIIQIDASPGSKYINY